MPYIDVRLEPAATPEQTAALARGITDAMVEVAGKGREVTAVRIDSTEAALWTIGAEPCEGTTAYLVVKITAGTNTREEKGALLRRLHALLVETLGDIAEAGYLVIHDLPAESWGYSGASQAERVSARL